MWARPQACSTRLAGRRTQNLEFETNKLRFRRVCSDICRMLRARCRSSIRVVPTPPPPLRRPALSPDSHPQAHVGPDRPRTHTHMKLPNFLPTKSLNNTTGLADVEFEVHSNTIAAGETLSLSAKG